LPHINKENYANASSIYSFGQKSRCAIEDAREEIANEYEIEILDEI
jgi:cysteine sulfinate desulfinase/cysteine desulfurase-like protein